MEEIEDDDEGDAGQEGVRRSKKEQSLRIRSLAAKPSGLLLANSYIAS